MTRVFAAAALAAVLFSSAPLHAGQAPPADPRLSPLAWLVGTWTGESRTPDGRPASNVFSFAWAPHKKAFVYEITRTVGGVTEPAMVGLCAWHPVKKQIVLWESSAEGDLTESTVRVDGARLAYEETIFGANGLELPVRAEAERRGDDAFTFTARVRQNDEWKVVFETTWRRKQ
jgi:hypothetical protein